MNIRTFLRSSSPEIREHVARAAGTSVAYLYVMASGQRHPSPRLCEKLIAAEPRFTREELRPDIYEPAMRHARATAQQQAAGHPARRQQQQG